MPGNFVFCNSFAANKCIFFN